MPKDPYVKLAKALNKALREIGASYFIRAEVARTLVLHFEDNNINKQLVNRDAVYSALLSDFET